MTKYETALITGGSTGIGAELAKALAKRGTRVAICARRLEPLEATQREIGDNCIIIQADVSDPDRVVEVVQEANERLGSLHLVVANAGFGFNRPAAKLLPKHFVSMVQTNVIGAFTTLAAAIPIMLEQQRGHLVGVSSLAGYRGLPTGAAYSATKAALSTFLESIRVDLQSTPIRVTDIRPGFVDTPLTQRNRYQMPFLVPADEAALKILGALDAERRVYAFPWPMWLAIKAVTYAPDWLYDAITRRMSVPEKEDA